MDRYECKFSVLYWVLLVLFVPITFGIGTIALLVSTRQWPREVDNEGITLRNGLRIPWSECTNVVNFGTRHELVFGGTTVNFPHLQIANGKKIMGKVRERLGVGPA